MSQIPGLEYLNLEEEDDDEEISSPIPQMILRPARVLNPRTFMEFTPEDWVTPDIVDITRQTPRRQPVSNGPRLDFGVPLFGRNQLFDIFQNQRSESVLEYSPRALAESSPGESPGQGLVDVAGNQRLQNPATLTPIPIPASLENNSTVQDMINELNEIENTESQLVVQIRQLEQAHAQLENARMNLINALIRLESTESRIRRNPFDDEDEDEEDEDEEQFLQELFHARLQQRQVDQRLGIPRIGFEHHHLDFDMFLDINGNPCSDFEDCLLRAVGWKGDFDQGLDRNGNELEITHLKELVAVR
jgi:hypothetical protein